MGFTYRRKTYWNCVNQCKNLHGNSLGEAATKKPINFKNSLAFSKTVFIKTTYFEDNLVNYFFENQSEQTWQTIKHFNKVIRGTLKKFLLTTRPILSAEKFLDKIKYKGFALEFSEEKSISLCRQQVETTRVPGVFYSEESSELKTDNLKISMEMFFPGVVDTFNFELLKERIIFF